MSLINQMLQDLESRRTQPAASNGDALNDLIWPGGQAAPARLSASDMLGLVSRSPVLRMAALAGLTLLVAVIFWGAWRVFAPHPAAPPAQVQAPAPAPSPASPGSCRKSW